MLARQPRQQLSLTSTSYTLNLNSTAFRHISHLTHTDHVGRDAPGSVVCQVVS